MKNLIRLADLQLGEVYEMEKVLFYFFLLQASEHG